MSQNVHIAILNKSLQDQIKNTEMKKMVLLISLCLTGIYPVFAQDNCKICGDWIGTCSLDDGYDTEDKTMIRKTYKIFVRIKQAEDNPIVRVKLVPVEGGNTWYLDNCEIMDASDSFMQWSKLREIDTDCDDESYREVVNGSKVGRVERYFIENVKYSNGVLHFTRNMWVVYYNPAGVQLHTEVVRNIISTTLYKDDNDW